MSSRIVTIINGLRAFTRDGSNDPLEFVSIQKIIEDTLVFCRGNFKSQGIELMVDKVPEDLQVYARPVQISQVLLNLLNNSYDAASEATEKWIRIVVQVTDSHLEMRVIDSGSGVAPELRSQLFQSFFTTKPVGKGTGLGLNIARTILTSHGGEIFLDESASDTTFVVRLPRVS
jgi:C4-dicarboxylate-specific signal transduction histidine kinase